MRKKKMKKKKMRKKEKENEEKENEEKENISVSPDKYGWIFLKSSWEEGDVWESLIIDNNGKSDKWYVDDENYEIPNKFPKDWNSQDLFIKEKNTWLDVNDVLQGLKIDREPNNWNRTIKRLKNQDLTDDLPEKTLQGWVTRMSSSGRPYYFNISTGETSWNYPLNENIISEPVSPPVSPSYNLDTPPVSPSTSQSQTDWVTRMSSSGLPYYFNISTGETSWNYPLNKNIISESVSPPVSPSYNLDTPPVSPSYNLDTPPVSPSYNLDTPPVSPSY